MPVERCAKICPIRDFQGVFVLLGLKHFLAVETAGVSESHPVKRCSYSRPNLMSYDYSRGLIDLRNQAPQLNTCSRCDEYILEIYASIELLLTPDSGLKDLQVDVAERHK